MTKSKELAKNTIIIFIGTFFTKFVQYFLLPIYTGYLSSAEYGTVELFNTIITLLIPIVGLQIEQGIFRFLISNRNNESNKKKLVSSSFFFLVLTSIIMLLIFLIINPFIKNEYKWIVVINLYFSLYSSYFMQVSRGLGKNGLYSISGCVTAVFTIIFNIIFLVGMHLKIDGMLYGSAIGYFFGIILLFFKLKIYNLISIKLIDVDSIKSMLNYSLPMIPNSISWWVFSSSDRIIISLFVGLSATGFLSIAYKFSNIGIIIYNVFHLSLTESITLHINDDDIENYFNNIYEKISSFFTSFCSITIALMPVAFFLLIDKSYASSYGLIPIAIIATLFQVYSGLLATIYIAKNNTKSIAITSIVSAIINIITDLAMVKFIGVYAAVISTLISFLTLFIYRIVDVNKKYMKVSISKFLIKNLLYTIFVTCLLYYFKNIYICILNIILSIALGLFFNRSTIRNLLISLKKKINFKMIKS